MPGDKTTSRPFTIGLIGRPNVGKSTLFNRLIKRKMAIVDDQPGVTRDWRTAPADIYGQPVLIMDTAGLENDQGNAINTRMRDQTLSILDRLDLILFMIDGRAGVTPMDNHFADIARKTGKPVILLVNKCEGKTADQMIAEGWTLGLGEPYPLSAEHGDGMSDIFSEMLDRIPEEFKFDDDDDDEESHESLPDLDDIEGDIDFEFKDVNNPDDDPDKPLKVAIVGRPNAGKSTLVNTLLGEERSLTGPEPGVTRDAVHADWTFGGRAFHLVDTAGMRRKNKVQDKIERLSVDDAIRAIRLAQIVVLVVDATGKLDKQDLMIADHVIKEGRILVVAINKWDAVDDKNGKLQEVKDRLQISLAQIPNIPMITISGLKNIRLEKLFGLILKTYETWNARVKTGPLNRWLAAQESHHPAPLVQGWPNRLRYITQIKARPPTFIVWVSRPKALPDSYNRYLINGLRDDFDLHGVPIRLIVKTSKNPYHD